MGIRGQLCRVRFTITTLAILSPSSVGSTPSFPLVTERAVCATGPRAMNRISCNAKTLKELGDYIWVWRGPTAENIPAAEPKSVAKQIWELKMYCFLLLVLRTSA